MDISVSSLKKGLKGEITIPADKSISHRAVMFASIANGNSVIRNFLNAADCCSTVNVFKGSGVDIDFIDKTTLNFIVT